MALGMTQSGENAAKANESAGLGGDFAGAEARALQDAGIEVIGFNKPIGLHGSKTKIDVETNGVIIEVTNGPKGKLVR